MVAAIEDCDPNFLIYRKFGWLHNRVILYHQDELVELEEEIERIDNLELQRDPKRLQSRRRDDALEGSMRRELILKIDRKLAEYGEQLEVNTNIWIPLTLQL